MALDKLVDSAQLDSDLGDVADAIRAKSGGSGQLAFPAGFISEIGSIETGGGGGIETVTISDSGSVSRAIDSNTIYVFTGNLTGLTISFNDGLDAFYQVVFSVGSTVPTISIPSGVNDVCGFVPHKNYKHTLTFSNGNLFVDISPILPNGFTKVSCVSIPEGGYVDTQKTAQYPLDSFFIDARVDSQLNATRPIIAAKYSQSNSFHLAAYTAYTGFIFQNSVNNFVSVHTKDNNRHRFVWDRFNYCRVDSTIQGNVGTSVGNGNVLISARVNENDSVTYSGTTVWGYTHSRTGEYLVDLVPCKQESNSEYGFFDTVTGAFFGNSGTGLFTEGAE